MYQKSLALRELRFTILINLTNIVNTMIYTLTSFNTGQITLPKKRRDKFQTKNFIAEETSE